MINKGGADHQDNWDQQEQVVQINLISAITRGLERIISHSSKIVYVENDKVLSKPEERSQKIFVDSDAI